MKSLILTTSLALSLSCGAAFAQGATDPQSAPPQSQGMPDGSHHHHTPNPQRQAARLSRKLSLTPDQTSRIEPILADRDQKMQALMANTQLTPQDRHQQMHALHQQTEQQLGSVLTPDQMTQMKAMEQEHRHHGPEGQPNGQPDAGQAPTT